MTLGPIVGPIFHFLFGQPLGDLSTAEHPPERWSEEHREGSSIPDEPKSRNEESQ